jgi:hypothetical protein
MHCIIFNNVPKRAHYKFLIVQLLILNKCPNIFKAVKSHYTILHNLCVGLIPLLRLNVRKKTKKETRVVLTPQILVLLGKLTVRGFPERSKKLWRSSGMAAVDGRRKITTFTGLAHCLCCKWQWSLSLRPLKHNSISPWGYFSWKPGVKLLIYTDFNMCNTYQKM